jgi:hypothetical protein
MILQLHALVNKMDAFPSTFVWKILKGEEERWTELYQKMKESRGDWMTREPEFGSGQHGRENARRLISLSFSLSLRTQWQTSKGDLKNNKIKEKIWKWAGGANLFERNWKEGESRAGNEKRTYRTKSSDEFGDPLSVQWLNPRVITTQWGCNERKILTKQTLIRKKGQRNNMVFVVLLLQRPKDQLRVRNQTTRLWKHSRRVTMERLWMTVHFTWVTTYQGGKEGKRDTRSVGVSNKTQETDVTEMDRRTLFSLSKVL